MMKSTPLLVIALAMLTACATKPAKQGDKASPSSGTDAVLVQPRPGDSGVVTVIPPATGSTATLSQEEREARDDLERRGNTIYFDYDSSQVNAEFLSLVATYAGFVNRFGGVELRLEGHSDERGSREYNIALGERRAQAVRRALEIQGVSAVRITTVSYGEERPAATGSSEASWSRNRRVEIRVLP